jgi:hypothetical protein
LKKNKKSSRISKKQLYICISQTNQLGGGYKQTNKMNKFQEFLEEGRSIYKVEHHKVPQSDRWISITRYSGTHTVGISYMQEAQDCVYKEFVTRYAEPQSHLSAFYMNLIEGFESNKDYDCLELELQTIDDAIWLYINTMTFD